MTKNQRWKSQLFTKIKTIALDDITSDLSMQQRAEFYDEIISEYTEILKGGGELAPLKVIRDENDTLWLWDGFHTLEAAKRAGQEKIKAEISRGTRREAWLKSLGANAKHGIRRSREDKRKAMRSALTDSEIKYSLMNEDGDHSLRSVAKLCNVHHRSIGRVWHDEIKPAIFQQIDDLLRLDLQGSQTTEEWFADIAKELSVPAWIVAERHVENAATRSVPEPSVTKDYADSLKGDALSTLQTDSTPEGTVTKDDADSLKGDALSTLQTEPAPEEEETATKNDTDSLKGVALSTLQTEPASEGSAAEIINISQPVPTEVTWPQNVIVHPPLEEQPYDGKQMVNTLVGYANKQCGLQVIEARRPLEGWSGKVGKEIGQALSRITDTGVENIGSILIVVVQE